MARNNTHCAIPVKCCKHCAWLLGARQRGETEKKKSEPSNVEMCEQLLIKTHLTGEKLG